MLIEQKRAWFVLAILAVAVIGYLILMAFAGPILAFVSFGVFGLAALTPVLFRNKCELNKVTEDERDKVIAKEATMGGAMSSYTAVVLICMISWFILKLQGKENISIEVLPRIVLVAAVVLFTVRAVAMLVMYGREPKNV